MTISPGLEEKTGTPLRTARFWPAFPSVVIKPARAKRDNTPPAVLRSLAAISFAA